MEKEILKYYSKFKEIYNEENYPEWFAFCNDHNKQFGDEGYKLGVSGHELKHFAILQTKIYEEKEIMIVGNNNSWFVPGNMRDKDSSPFDVLTQIIHSLFLKHLQAKL